ncbi:hypothetical protein BST79_gp109 [Only Syngen Nebraska virus 5]|uniref:hypothetical protein n=1 Tax=Only Syngen Nebraska virus 5 TaxID=1917232 RepID=UPI0009011AEB|nr:hypothetical protein BST79_gp109 [Only Syngen Nebraska virus 5]APC25622.1 hypothetical protein [Only Syngen Nebraska virus 5]
MNLSLPNTVDTVTKTAKKTATDLTVRFADMIVAAAGIVAALSWNDAIKSLFADGGVFYKFAKGGPWIAATLITLFAVAIGFWRAKLIPSTPPKK